MSVETSKPLGAVAVTVPVNPLPLTVKDCEAEAVPLAVIKPPRLEGVVLTMREAVRRIARRPR